MLRSVRSHLSLHLFGLLVLVCLCPTTRAATFTTVHQFGRTAQESAGASAGLTRAKDGNLYGTSKDGGAFGAGTVYRMTPDGIVTVLYSFQGSADGGHPQSRLVQAADGAFYGMTFWGTNNGGVAYKITTSGVMTILHTFYGGNKGVTSMNALVQAKDGNFYGTTQGGAANFGTIFQMTPAGAVTTLYTFTNTGDGAYPSTALVQASDGTFYGGTQGAESGDSWGTVYRFVPGSGLSVIHAFSTPNPNTYANAEGWDASSLTLAGDGSLYGTTSDGGAHDFGTLFHLTLDGTLTVLQTCDGSNGAHPKDPLLPEPDGNLYGTMTNGDSTAPGGIAFKITPDGVLTILHVFADEADGRYTNGLLWLEQGRFFGTTQQGGTYGFGTAFVLDVAEAAPPASVALSPARLWGGLAATGTVTLANPAAFGGATLALASSNPAARVPASVTIPFGATQVTFPVTTVPVAAETAVSITASGANVAKSAALSVAAPALASFTFNAAAIAVGTAATGTVTLTGKAAVTTNVTVLYGGKPYAAITVAAGQTSGRWTLTGGRAGTFPFTAALAAVRRNATLTVAATLLKTFALSPASIKAGTKITLTATLTAKATTATALKITTGSTYLMTLTIPAGATSGTALLTGSRAGTFPLTATDPSGVTKTVLLTVTP